MKTIEVDPFDIQSINKAIDALKAHETWRKQRITEYIHRLCMVGANAAQQTYGSSKVRVSVTPDGQGIIAEGDQVVFLEFGTGEPTQDHELSGTLNIEIMPGSWSESPEGKHTWSKWLTSDPNSRFGGKAGRRWGQSYPYNTTPRPGMWAAYKAIVAEQGRIAKEVFERD